MIINQQKGRKEADNLSRTGMFNLTKVIPRPGFFVETSNGLMIDNSHPEWILYCKKRHMKKKTPMIPPPKDGEWTIEDIPVDDGKKQNFAGTMAELSERAAEAQLREQIGKAELIELKGQHAMIELEKSAGNLIEYEFAEFLFFGFMERCFLEIGRIPRKIRYRIDPLIKENNLSGIISLLEHELQTVLSRIKKEQAADVENWAKEQKINKEAKSNK